MPPTTDETPPPWIRRTMFVAVVFTFWLPSIVAQLMRLTGVKGAFAVLVALAPLYVGAVASWRRAHMPDAFGALAALCGLQALSSFEGHFAFEGLLRALPLPTTFAWAVVFGAWPSLLPSFLRWCIGCWVAATALEAVSPELFARPNYMLGFLPLCLYAFLRHEGRVSERAAAWWVVLAPALVAIVVRSTFRSGSIAAVVLFLWMAARWWGGRAGLAVAALAATGYVATAAESAPTFSRSVERTDYVGRFRAIDEDNFSGRGDIWEGVWHDVQQGPDWLWTGVGFGDADILIARVNPYFAASLRHGERVVHSHNQAIDVLVSTGLPGVALLLLCVALIARRCSLRDPTGAIGIGLVVVAMANVVLIDGAGAAPCIGLLLAHLPRPHDAHLSRPHDAHLPLVAAPPPV